MLEDIYVKIVSVLTLLDKVWSRNEQSLMVVDLPLCNDDQKQVFDLFL